MDRRFNINEKNDRSLGNLNRYNDRITSQQVNNSEDVPKESNNANSVTENTSTINATSMIQKVINKNSIGELGELKDVKIKIPVTTKIVFIAVIISIFAFVFLMIFITILIGGDDESNIAMATGGYYAMRCSEVTVKFADKNNGYEITRTATYPLEEYVAGVVAGEVGFLNNLEVDKELAIAARTYLLTHDSNCTIESSDRKQVFRELTGTGADNLAKQAAEETAGKVLLKNNELFGTEYDAFCSIAVSATEYTLKQKNQKIPRSWADGQRGIAESWKQGTCEGNHGRGLSQWGSYYLATEKNYKYDEILKYYLGDDVVIMVVFQLFGKVLRLVSHLVSLGKTHRRERHYKQAQHGGNKFSHKVPSQYNFYYNHSHFIIICRIRQ